MNKYTKELKESLVRKLLMPGAPTLQALSDETGIPPSTMYTWKLKYIHPQSNAMVPGMKQKTIWTPEKKLDAITAMMSLSEQECGEYLRKNGIHSDNILEWKKECLESLRTAGRPKVDSELINLKKKCQQAEKDINRKDRALAEMAARIVLIKKTQLLFGESEDEE